MRWRTVRLSNLTIPVPLPLPAHPQPPGHRCRTLTASETGRQNARAMAQGTATKVCYASTADGVRQRCPWCTRHVRQDPFRRSAGYGLKSGFSIENRIGLQLILGLTPPQDRAQVNLHPTPRRCIASSGNLTTT